MLHNIVGKAGARPESRPRTVRRAPFVIGLLVGLIAAAGLTPRAALGAPPTGIFKGEAYGTFASGVTGPIAVTLGKTAYLPCPCQGTNGQTRQNTIDALAAGSDGRVLRADVVTSTVLTRKTTSSAVVTNSSTISGLNMFGGLITATAVKAVANTTALARTMTSNANGSTFTNLVIDGRTIAANPAPNTRISLRGIGTVVLNRAVVAGTGQKVQQITVEMLTVEVNLANSFGLPVGARIVVAHAISGFSRTTLIAPVGGQAYAAEANAAIGSDLRNRIGKAALVTMGCEGTNGQTRTNNVEALNVGTVLRIGTGETTAFGGANGSGGTIARTTATIENTSLLNSLITFTAITVVAEDRFNGSTHVRSTAGTQFVGLQVAGIDLPLTVTPNLRVNLPLIGYVIVNEQIIPAAARRGLMQVNGLRIVVTTTNTLGLPVGSQIIVAHADATAQR